MNAPINVPMTTPVTAPMTAPMNAVINPYKEVYLDVADRIGRNLCRDAVWDGARCNWLGWSMEAVNQNWVPAYRSFAGDLYGGTSGIALFLAELHQFSGDKQQKRILEGALNQALSLSDKMQGPARSGFYAGSSGFAYVLVRIGTLLKNEALIARGLREMASLKEQVPDAMFIDVIGGSAGAIPAMLKLGLEHQRPDFIAMAQSHGDYLLTHASKSDAGWSWETMHVPGQKHLTGHSHGVAGIVTALLELYRATEEKRYLDGANEGLRYERGLFSAQHNNWPDLRIMDASQTDAPPVYNMAWCHGAPGIGLSRLRNVALMPDDAMLMQELHAAVQTTASSLMPAWVHGIGNFSLCHGACGNAELMIMAGQYLKRPDLTQIAEKIGQEGWQHYGQSDMPWPCGVAGTGETPNLMLGTAGIGHFYLRLYNPEAVPSVLIVTPPEKVGS